MNPYEILARFYDLENADRVEDLPLWAELARENGDPVLELGCGSGRVAMHLAREGFRVIGVDSSPAMLERAKSRLARNAKAASQVQYLLDDFTRLNLAQTFPLILFPFNTFAHLLERPDWNAALQAVAAHLDPQGRVALELPNPMSLLAPVPDGLVLEHTFRDEERGITIQQFSSLRVDRIAQRWHISWLYDEIDPEGNVRRTIVPMTLRYFLPEEMHSLLLQAGLRMVHLWGDYARGALEENSPTMIVVGGR
jgi:SAM-dependent methyltransferase